MLTMSDLGLPPLPILLVQGHPCGWKRLCLGRGCSRLPCRPSCHHSLFGGSLVYGACKGTLTTISAPQRMRYTLGMRKERNLGSYIILFQATNISEGVRDGS